MELSFSPCNRSQSTSQYSVCALRSCFMAYLPPHKRHSNDMEKPSPTAELLAPLFNRKLDLRASGRKVDRSGRIIYADQARHKWFIIGDSDDDNLFPSCVRLEPIALRANEHRMGEKHLALVYSNVSQGNKEEEEEVVIEPWASIVVKLLPDLLSSIEHIKNEMNQDEEVKPTLVARIGKVIFHGTSEFDSNKLPTRAVMGQLKRSFRTNVSETYIENIRDKVIPLIGVKFEEEKDTYHIKLSDAEHPHVTLTCKCTALPELNKLELYKVELNPVRHMVADISCLKQNVDMRVMTFSKKTVGKLTDDEMEGILDLINSAILDKDVKGGLRWPLGKASSGDRFKVVGAWHTVSQSYVNPFVRIKLRNADRYDFKTLVGEVSNEVTFKMKRLTSELLREKAEVDVISDMLNENLKLFWNHFVCSATCSSPF
ncbi:uncharacterized protein LOC111798921 isoform X2 [Cucurbita pepo subsp. pepo]|uniref:uncharacterized protein LOC111798921 isoform X2 n=1 Tax=Cucurbita pepo subsp. pepo TaxID=3664 RepID=UPI000C9D5FD9|nr:uncharacterized protein LOC111798921 isoform X2 [Cucurbita pepo subsp. pepo]